MFVLRNIPVVVEPGVGAIEAEFVRVVGKNKEERIVAVQLCRLPLDSTTLPELPFVPDTKTPHVFSTTTDPKNLSTLVVYDFLGRITVLYVRDSNGGSKTWEKHHVAEEHAGKTITQFSVRFCFNSVKSRDAFMAAIEHLVGSMLQNQEPSPKALKDALRLLSRSRIAPVALPVAVAKSNLKELKIP